MPEVSHADIERVLRAREAIGHLGRLCTALMSWDTRDVAVLRAEWLRLPPRERWVLLREARPFVEVLAEADEHPYA